MTNSSLKEQLQAVASQIISKKEKNVQPKKSYTSEKYSKVKPHWLDYARYGVELLRVYFPQSFKSGNEVLPLKKGIKIDLVKRLSGMGNIVTEDKACMVKSLSYYVNTLAYHKNMKEGVSRIDLDGNPQGVVSAEEAKYASNKHQAKLNAKHSKQNISPLKSKQLPEIQS